ncbi:hypothetical protein [Silvanigrella aquatica]|uniref:Uncharacterized protein n=1 Tax=Silvanigrella aquatica TaxID=1915309 RepID=A0A1L4D1H4_9BACT|nr:hypothetical protein [Silvanigrella aquatica]APJ04047.1 hypothetical protein AXG55_09060 [Silvanigrella aquatica]
MKHGPGNQKLIRKFLIITSLLPSITAYPMFSCFGLKSKKIAEKNISISKENLSKIQEILKNSIHSSEISLEISSNENNTITKTPVIIKDSVEFKIYIDAINKLREIYFEQLETNKTNDLKKIDQIYENQNTILEAKHSKNYSGYKIIKELKTEIEKNKIIIDRKIENEVSNEEKLKEDILNENSQILKAIENINSIKNQNNFPFKSKTALKNNLKDKINFVFLKDILDTLSNDIIDDQINTEEAQKEKLVAAIDNLNFIIENNKTKIKKIKQNLDTLESSKNELNKYHLEKEYYQSVKSKVKINKLINKINSFEIKKIYDSIQKLEENLQNEYLNIINIIPKKPNYKDTKEYQDNIKFIENELIRKKHNLLFDQNHSNNLNSLKTKVINAAKKDNLDAKVFSYATYESKKEADKKIQFYSISGEFEFSKNYNKKNELYFVNLKNPKNRKLSYFEPKDPEKLRSYETKLANLQKNIIEIKAEIKGFEDNQNTQNRQIRIDNAKKRLEIKEKEYSELNMIHQNSIDHEIERAYINTKGEKEIGNSPRSSDAEAKILEELLNLTIPNPEDITYLINERFFITKNDPDRRSTTQRAKYFFDLDNFKSLNYYNLNQDIEGTLNIYTSLDTCASCKNAYSLFKILRPKIDLNIYTLNKDLQTFIYKNDFNANN